MCDIVCVLALKTQTCAPPQVRLFYSLLPQRQRWAELRDQPAELLIDEVRHSLLL